MNLSYRLGWHFFRFLFATYFRWRVYNTENVPLEGPAILASNHASFLDPPLVGVPLRRTVYSLARASLFRFWLFGAILRSWLVIPLDREGGSPAGMKRIWDELKHGGAIVIFPEGTRTRDGRLQPAHSGIGLTVIKSTAPVIPVRLFGTYEAFNRKAWFPKPHRIAIKYGKPLNFDALRAEAKTCDKARLRAIYQEAADQIMAAIGKLEPKAD